MHVITPKDLKKFQIEHYSKLLEKPTSEPHKKFLINELKHKTTFYENKNLQTQTKIRIRTVGKSQTTQGISKGAEY
jgi:hypothetical protein